MAALPKCPEFSSKIFLFVRSLDYNKNLNEDHLTDLAAAARLELTCEDEFFLESNLFFLQLLQTFNTKSKVLIEMFSFSIFNCSKFSRRMK